jgi:hypothetical protein
MFTVVMGLGWLLWPPARGEVHIARGTVVQAVDCGPSGAQDELLVELLDGREIPARLDGCGHRSGEVLTVEVSEPLPTGDVVARVVGTGVPATTAGEQRITAAGAAISGLAGALLAWRLRGQQS